MRPDAQTAAIRSRGREYRFLWYVAQRQRPIVEMRTCGKRRTWKTVVRRRAAEQSLGVLQSFLRCRPCTCPKPFRGPRHAACRRSSRLTRPAPGLGFPERILGPQAFPGCRSTRGSSLFQFSGHFTAETRHGIRRLRPGRHHRACRDAVDPANDAQAQGRIFRSLSCSAPTPAICRATIQVQSFERHGS